MFVEIGGVSVCTARTREQNCGGEKETSGPRIEECFGRCGEVRCKPQIAWHGSRLDLSPEFYGQSGLLATAALVHTAKGKNGALMVTMEAYLCYHSKAVKIVRVAPTGRLLASGAMVSIAAFQTFAGNHSVRLCEGCYATIGSTASPLQRWDTLIWKSVQSSMTRSPGGRS